MQGLINRAIQCFVVDTHGERVWYDVIARSSVGFNSFEAFLDYPISTTLKLVDAVERVTSLPKSSFLEDLGVYLVTSPTTKAVRRLLRFGGQTFEDFVLSLDELPERINLAFADIVLPRIEVTQPSSHTFMVTVSDGIDGFDFVVVGVLRALADDYGALAFIDLSCDANASKITVLLADSGFGAGRNFDFENPLYALG